MIASKGSESPRDNFGKFMYQIQRGTKTLIRKIERILTKLYRQNLSLLFNETWLNEQLQPNYTHTHTHTYTRARAHTHTHIYIYIYILLVQCEKSNYFKMSKSTRKFVFKLSIYLQHVFIVFQIIFGLYDYKTSKYEDLKKELEKEEYSVIVKLWSLEQEVSLQAPCTNFWDKLGSFGVIEAKVWNALQK